MLFSLQSTPELPNAILGNASQLAVESRADERHAERHTLTVLRDMSLRDMNIVSSIRRSPLGHDAVQSEKKQHVNRFCEQCYILSPLVERFPLLALRHDAVQSETKQHVNRLCEQCYLLSPLVNKNPILHNET